MSRWACVNQNIIEIFRYCVNQKENLLRSRKIEQSEPEDNTNRPDMDVVIEETVVPRALSAQESTSLVDLTLSPAEVQMNNWKPIVQNIMQQFADYENEGYDIKTCLCGISLKSRV